ncbi:hypothetical protein ACP4OV_010506 [Aristida adscensionis]
MKFGKWLKKQIKKSLPEWREQFLRYKELKRCVKAVSGGRPPSPAEEAVFVGFLHAEIETVGGHQGRIAGGGPARRHHPPGHCQLPRRDGAAPQLQHHQLPRAGQDREEVREAHGGGAVAAGDRERAGKALLQDGDSVADGVWECEAMLEAAAATHRDREALALTDQSIFCNTVVVLLMQDVRAESSTYDRHSLPPLGLPNYDWLRFFQ